MKLIPGLTNRSQLATKLTTSRLTAGLSVRQLEQLSGVPRATISRLEHDAVDQPAADTLVKLARALELNAADVFLLAGLPLLEESASLDVMLRTNYGLSPSAVAEAKAQIEAIVRKYDRDP